LLVCGLAAPSFTTAIARAEPSAAEIAVARKLFKEATDLEKEKKWDEAEPLLRKALAIKETPGLRYHLAFCLEQQGKLVDALVDYDRADEMIKAGAKAPDVAELVVSARESLKQRIPTLTVKLPQGVEGTELKIDGRVLSSAVAGQPLPLNPGKHKVEVSAPGRANFAQEVRLGENEKRDLSVVLDAKSDAAPAAAPGGGNDGAPQADSGAVSTDSSGWSARTWVLVGEGALAAVGLGVGIFATLDKSKAQDELDAAEAERDRMGTQSGEGACDNPEQEDENACKQIPTLRDQVDSAGTLQTLGFVGAGVGVVAGVVTFLVWKPKTQSEARALPRVYAMPTRGGGFVGVGASF
jgi:tetratricopeptide (TPR) repeat protein